MFYYVVKFEGEVYPYLYKTEAEALNTVIEYLNEVHGEGCFDNSLTREEAEAWNAYLITFDVMA